MSALLHIRGSLRPIIPIMGKKLNPKKSKKYFTIMEALWKIGAPILVAVGKTVLESKVPFLK